MLITFIILSSSCCYENIHIMECLGKIMSHQKTAFCLCRLHLLASFHHFRFNSPARTRSLNWTSNQSSLSHRRPWRRFNMLNQANYRRREPDESRRVEHTKQTRPTDAHRWPSFRISSLSIFINIAKVWRKSEMKPGYWHEVYVVTMLKTMTPFLYLQRYTYFLPWNVIK